MGVLIARDRCLGPKRDKGEQKPFHVKVGQPQPASAMNHGSESVHAHTFAAPSLRDFCAGLTMEKTVSGNFHHHPFKSRYCDGQILARRQGCLSTPCNRPDYGPFCDCVCGRMRKPLTPHFAEHRSISSAFGPSVLTHCKWPSNTT